MPKFNKKFVFKVLKSWVPLAATVTLLCGVIYLMMQQTYRMDANDPQVQIVGDVKAALEDGATPDQMVGQSKADIGKTLDPFIIIYDSSKKIVVTSATLNGSSPSIPSGVLDQVAKKGEERVTWQPQKDVRIAAVVVKYKDGFIVAGRNIKEVESRIEKHGINMLIGWAITLLGTLFTVVAVRVVCNRLKEKK